MNRASIWNRGICLFNFKPMSLNESIVEDAALEWFGELGYAVGHRPRGLDTMGRMDLSDED